MQECIFVESDVAAAVTMTVAIAAAADAAIAAAAAAAYAATGIHKGRCQTPCTKLLQLICGVHERDPDGKLPETQRAQKQERRCLGSLVPARR